MRNTIPLIEFNHGLIDFDELTPNQNNLVVLDDLMAQCENDDRVRQLFTVDSHHLNISVFFLVQNLFAQGKYFREISRNSHYMILFDNARDLMQIETLARQMYRNKKTDYFMECFEDATKEKHGHLFLDFKSGSKYRLQTNIESDQRILYKPKEP